MHQIQYRLPATQAFPALEVQHNILSSLTLRTASETYRPSPKCHKQQYNTFFITYVWAFALGVIYTRRSHVFTAAPAVETQTARIVRKARREGEATQKRDVLAGCIRQPIYRASTSLHTCCAVSYQTWCRFVTFVSIQSRQQRENCVRSSSVSRLTCVSINLIQYMPR